LRGTGSHDWQVTNVFVPEVRTFPVLRDGPSAPGALSTRDFFTYGGARVAAVALGIAREAIDAFTALAKTKTPLL
jgi:alkylation response protein AidB-like acyl-CoA dehydrogenase